MLQREHAKPSAVTRIQSGIQSVRVPGKRNAEKIVCLTKCDLGKIFYPLKGNKVKLYILSNKVMF